MDNESIPTCGDCVTITKERYDKLLEYERIALWVLNTIVVSSLPSIELTADAMKDISNDAKCEAIQKALQKKIWYNENDAPKYNQNGVTDFIVSSAYGHIEGEAHTYTPEQWSAHLGFNAHREFRWAYESDLIDFD